VSLTVGSLFSGIGGFDLGFERAGFEIRWQCEADPFCRRVLETHWPGVRCYEDVRHIGEGVEPVDVIVGGDPCQENSRARRVHERCLAPSLGGEFIRVVAALRPRVVVRENPSAVRSDAPWPWQRFRSELEALDYGVVPFRLRACCFGADHRRDRLFLLGERADAMRAGLEGWDERRSCLEALQAEYHGETWGAVPEVGRVSLWLGAGSARLRSGTRVSGGLDSRRIRALGNAVVPQIAQWIAEQILGATEAGV
jgi:DNA (cytosine-5)-methyltransferase 1